jgi:hypothetical protein
VTCNNDLYVFNKSNYKSKPRLQSLINMTILEYCYNIIYGWTVLLQSSQCSEWLRAWWPKNWGSIPGWNKSFLSSIEDSGVVWDPPASYPINTGDCFLGVRRPGRDADHLPHLVPTLRLLGSVHPLTYTSSWRSAQLVTNKGNVTYLYMDERNISANLQVQNSFLHTELHWHTLT